MSNQPLLIAADNLAKACERLLVKAGVPNKIVALIGDSTFMHAGVTALIDVVYNNGKTTVIILDNETTGMTGHQGHPGSGISARGTETNKVKIEELVKGTGVKDISVISAFDMEAIESTIKRCLETDAPSIGLDGVLPEQTEPGHVRDVAAAVAALRDESLETVAEVTTANACRLFKLPN